MGSNLAEESIFEISEVVVVFGAGVALPAAAPRGAAARARAGRHTSRPQAEEHLRRLW